MNTATVDTVPVAQLTPQEAWDELYEHRTKYYNRYAAAYSGSRLALNSTGAAGSFWKRKGKCKMHVPVAADISSTSSDLLFSEEPRFTCEHKGTEVNEDTQQQRLDDLIAKNNLHSLLNEAAESCSALGDVYLKLNWRANELDYPTITVVQPDNAWPEYLLGIPQCIHFFSFYKQDRNKNIFRLYECYSKGKIEMAIFQGTKSDLGHKIDDAELNRLGFDSVVKAPVDDLLAVHIPNIRPNRSKRHSMLGRSDYDGLRDLMDALDETYSSWMRDIRLAKARLIVPAEYLRRSQEDLFKDGQYTYEFDEDVETLVALDIDPEHKPGSTITPSQFQIRADEHAKTAENLIRQIISIAGYSPQTFGLDIEGQAQSGTALHIREKKSFSTRGKKQTYWTNPLQALMTGLLHLDAAFYPRMGSHPEDVVKIHFSDSMASDLSTISSAVLMLHNAQAVSTKVKIQMLHPDWTNKQIDDEVASVLQEYTEQMPTPNPAFGDLDKNANNPTEASGDNDEERVEEDE